jgi:hypothetical protein
VACRRRRGRGHQHALALLALGPVRHDREDWRSTRRSSDTSFGPPSLHTIEAESNYFTLNVVQYPVQLHTSVLGQIGFPWRAVVSCVSGGASHSIRIARDPAIFQLDQRHMDHRASRLVLLPEGRDCADEREPAEAGQSWRSFANACACRRRKFKFSLPTVKRKKLGFCRLTVDFQKNRTTQYMS